MRIFWNAAGFKELACTQLEHGEAVEKIGKNLLEMHLCYLSNVLDKKCDVCIHDVYSSNERPIEEMIASTINSCAWSLLFYRLQLGFCHGQLCARSEYPVDSRHPSNPSS